MLWLCGQVVLPAGRAANPRLYVSAEVTRGFIRWTREDGTEASLIVALSGVPGPDVQVRAETFELREPGEGELLFQSTFAYPQTADRFDILLPSVIKAALPRDEATIEFVFDRPVLNPDLSGLEDRLFSVTIPDTFEARPLAVE